ncbi:SDR family NAD(P)-dependent oxidoreductase [Microbacterium sp. ASV49]|uniref:SDR family oxidoreductase n=1 Tax=Microbacterium candidum TaxID=3041922 RepID=A0ABT7N0J6_9MICO|nr:SDR family oxidoreductase [Microbacterium sp. ASV49]MDL9980207.1 SDR family oxidoreductase [Microbacterium sp. ASV49]
MELGLRGRTALVTGAAGGIGAAAARALAAEGVRIALLDRGAAALGALAASLPGGFDAASVHPADVTDEGQVAAAVAAAVERWGGLDILIGCAGISGPVGTPLLETTAAQWDAVFDVNVRGSFLVLRAALPALREGRDASVVFVASDSALVAAPGMAPYCASKAAVLQFARAASVELAAEGIRVNAVCPSIVDTPMSRGDLGIDGFADVAYPVQTADEVAAQLVFLASPVSRPVNGTSLVTDFGYTARSNFPA